MKTVLLNEDWKETWVIGDGETDEDEDANLKQFVDAFSTYFSRKVGEQVTVDFSYEVTHQDSYEGDADYEPFETGDCELNKWDVAYSKTCRAFETGDIWKPQGIVAKIKNLLP